MPRDTFGGGFVYHLNDDRAYVGLVVGLDYRDPLFQPFEAFQRFKSHPMLRDLCTGGEALAYGARAIAAGGAQALPRMEMPGAVLIGDAAGTLDAARIKGIHQAMRSGMLCAEHLTEHGTVKGYDAAWRASPGGKSLQAVRNIKPGFKRGLWFGQKTTTVRNGQPPLLGGVKRMREFLRFKSRYRRGGPRSGVAVPTVIRAGHDALASVE